jgi:NAD(P)-dependent dehydrogenase (short-subunit alcohol dehydrogenase family)
MRSLANELAPRRIRVNTIHPTQVATPMIETEEIRAAFCPDLEDPDQADFERASEATMLLPTPWVEPGDVAEAVVFLASDASRYITGVALPIDAGALAK